MRTALLILHPREIPDCMEALAALDVPKCWVSFMPEVDAARACNAAIQDSDYDRYVVISDDTVPTQEALDAVLALHDEHLDSCVTGYCQLADDTPLTNLTDNKLPPPPPSVASYAFLQQKDIDESPGSYVMTTFAGLALTCMVRDLWLTHPLEVSSLGGQMDYVLSYNLAKSGVSIYAAKDGYVKHVKERWNQLDEAPEKRLLIGQRPAGLFWTHTPGEHPTVAGQAAPPVPRVQQHPRGQRILGLLSYFDEPVKVLTGCLSAMARAGIDHVVAVDGRYELYPGEEYLSPMDQTGAIAIACARLGMGCTLHVPPGPWVGEPEKRSHLFMVALAESDPGDWFFVVDADELIEYVPPNLRERLQAAEEDVAVVTMRDMTAEVVNKPLEYPIWFYRRSLFKAQPIAVVGNHHTYVTMDGRVLWDAKPEKGQVVPALDLLGGRFADDGAPREEALDPNNGVVVQHWAGARGEERTLKKATYYANREEQRTERLNCEWCAAEGKEVKAARRVTVNWRLVEGLDKPIADIVELCDECGKKADYRSRKALIKLKALCGCKPGQQRPRAGTCQRCSRPVDLSGVRINERNGRPAIV